MVPAGASVGLNGLVFKPALDHEDRRAGGRRHLAQEGAALAVGLDQGDAAACVEDGEHHAGEARAASDIDGVAGLVVGEQGERAAPNRGKWRVQRALSEAAETRLVRRCRRRRRSS